MKCAQFIVVLLCLPLVNSRPYGENNAGQFLGVSGTPSQSVKTDWFKEYVDAHEQLADEEEASNETGKSMK